MSIVVACLLLGGAGAPAGGSPSPSVDVLRARGRRDPADFGEGRMEAVDQRHMEFAWHRCRTLPAQGSFDHGEGTLSLTLCPSGGAWRPFQVEIEPVMTAALFDTMVRNLVTRELKLPEAEVRCPASLVPIGDTATCTLTTNGRRRELKVRRSANSHIEVDAP